jgi:Fe-S cluster biosynthesis and repair protein YggX
MGNSRKLRRGVERNALQVWRAKQTIKQNEAALKEAEASKTPETIQPTPLS